MRKLFGLAAILFALAACNKIELVEPVDPAEPQGGIHFTAILDQPSTKALSDAGSTVTASGAGPGPGPGAGISRR